MTGRPFPTLSRQRGLGMVELLVAMAIGLFMLAGMFTIFYSTRQTWGAQQGLAGLQDNERLAMTLIANVVQPAGYFPDPLQQTALAALPLAAPFGAAGQAVVGSTSAGQDSLAVRYVSAPGDGLLNCLGRSNTGSTAVTWVNQFQVDPTRQRLDCTLNGETHGLVSGIAAMQVLYGVDSTGDGSADQYFACRQRRRLVGGALGARDPGLRQPAGGPARPAADARLRPHHRADEQHMKTPREQGFVLIASLLMLVVLTLLAVSMSRSFGLQERMAGNLREKARAFDAAQSSLSYAEWWLTRGSNASQVTACSARARTHASAATP
jgi:prepilin-type N-terminal cleavage/methylation domain